MAEDRTTDNKHPYLDILKKHRVTLVENLNISDGLCDFLIQYEIASERTVNRIQQCQTREEKVECLLRHLKTRPPKDFVKFARALAETNQPHLAELFSTVSLKARLKIHGMRKRKRQNRPNAPIDYQIEKKYKEIELLMLDRIVQYEKELRKKETKMARKLEKKIDMLLERIRLIGGRHGSILLYIMCPNIDILDYLWLLSETGGLTKIFQEYLVTSELLDMFDLVEIQVDAGILSTDYMAYRNYLETQETQSRGHSVESAEFPECSSLKTAKQSSRTSIQEFADTTVAQETFLMKDKQIDELKKQITEMKAREAALQEASLMKDNQIDELRKEITAIQDASSYLDQSIERWRKERAKIKNTSSDLDQSIQQRRKALRKTRYASSPLDLNIEPRRKEAAEIKNTSSDLDQSIQQRRKELHKRKYAASDLDWNIEPRRKEAAEIKDTSSDLDKSKGQWRKERAKIKDASSSFYKSKDQ